MSSTFTQSDGVYFFGTFIWNYFPKMMTRSQGALGRQGSVDDILLCHPSWQCAELCTEWRAVAETARSINHVARSLDVNGNRSLESLGRRLAHAN